MSEELFFINDKVKVKPESKSFDPEYDKGQYYYIVGIYAESDGAIMYGISDRKNSIPDCDGFYFTDLELVEASNIQELTTLREQVALLKENQCDTSECSGVIQNKLSRLEAFLNSFEYENDVVTIAQVKKAMEGG